MKIRTQLLAGALLASGVAAPFALAQQQTINDYVRETIAEFADPAERLVDEIYLEEIAPGTSAEVIFAIDPDKTYYAYGACDEDCSNIDLAAHDANEEWVDADDDEDAAPFLLILPGESGDEVHVVVDLVDCGTETCVVGVGLYETDD